MEKTIQAVRCPFPAHLAPDVLSATTVCPVSSEWQNAKSLATFTWKRLALNSCSPLITLPASAAPGHHRRNWVQLLENYKGQSSEMSLESRLQAILTESSKAVKEEKGAGNERQVNRAMTQVSTIPQIRYCGLKTSLLTSPLVGFMVTNQCKYHTPISFPQIPVAALAVEKMGRSSVCYRLALFPPKATKELPSVAHAPGLQVLLERGNDDFVNASHPGFRASTLPILIDQNIYLLCARISFSAKNSVERGYREDSWALPSHLSSKSHSPPGFGYAVDAIQSRNARQLNIKQYLGKLAILQQRENHWDTRKLDLAALHAENANRAENSSFLKQMSKSPKPELYQTQDKGTKQTPVESVQDLRQQECSSGHSSLSVNAGDQRSTEVVLLGETAEQMKNGPSFMDELHLMKTVVRAVKAPCFEEGVLGSGTHMGTADEEVAPHTKDLIGERCLVTVVSFGAIW
ncbi:hypothetical protein A6R68_04828 [Neotoma lepida]|uniref:Uncharacterized protein n=1 Tax=Neotoma lepida TaxID=56216 RepID=A0A1A6GK33_NEOLE|nr:hypothetical protein A6R68_04828 [Neotoma lepida]